MPGYPRPRTLSPTPLREVAALLRTAPRQPRPGIGAGDDAQAGDQCVTGITHASQEVCHGDCYAALPGARHHGASFARAAADAGARALLTDARGAELAADIGLPMIVVNDPRACLGTVADMIYGQPTSQLPVVGITGTAGKTSTAYLVAAGLRAAGLRPGVIGTVETRIGDLVVEGARTTPEATDLHALFAVARENGVDAIAMEVSSHALALGRVGGVRFAVGGFTNFGVDHLDFHSDLDDYFAAKARLFDGRCGVEIVNVGDSAGRRLVQDRTWTYAPPRADVAGARVDWFASDGETLGYGQRFVVNGPGGIRVPSGVTLPGPHNVANALLAVASLVALGVDPAIAGRAVATCSGAPGRMERVPSAAGIVGIVDYAHKPDAVGEVLAAIRGLKPGKTICVIGAGGDRDRGKRPMMGAEAAQGADVVIVTDDNPRGEDPAAIRAAVLEGARNAGTGARILEIPDREQAIVEAVALARPTDVVAVLGKGHERGQTVGQTIYPFDDREQLSQALAALGTGSGRQNEGARR